MNKEEGKSNKILVSIIVPCYNQAAYLDEALQSLFNQSLKNWECIIINDGSTDNTEEVAKTWCIKDERYKYLYKLNGGLSSARNYGIKQAKGDWIQFLDADDFLQKEKLQHSIDIVNDNKKLNLVLTDFKCYYQDTKSYSQPFCTIKRIIDLKSILLYWDTDFVIPIHCAIISKSLLVDGFDENLRAKEDWLLWINLFSKSIHYALLEDHLAIYRIHKESMTKDLNLMEENTLTAYKKIYSCLDDLDLKSQFFERVINDVMKVYRIKNEDIFFFKTSFSYRIGSFFLKPIKILRSLFKNIIAKK